MVKHKPYSVKTEYFYYFYRFGPPIFPWSLVQNIFSCPSALTVKKARVFMCFCFCNHYLIHNQPPVAGSGKQTFLANAVQWTHHYWLQHLLTSPCNLSAMHKISLQTEFELCFVSINSDIDSLSVNLFNAKSMNVLNFCLLSGNVLHDLHHQPQLILNREILGSVYNFFST
jgi:hypothetical protein